MATAVIILTLVTLAMMTYTFYLNNKFLKKHAPKWKFYTLFYCAIISIMTPIMIYPELHIHGILINCVATLFFCFRANKLRKMLKK
jgi:O-antigen/teichoic acid export membrane protein